MLYCNCRCGGCCGVGQRSVVRGAIVTDIDDSNDFPGWTDAEVAAYWAGIVRALKLAPVLPEVDDGADYPEPLL